MQCSIPKCNLNQQALLSEVYEVFISFISQVARANLRVVKDCVLKIKMPKFPHQSNCKMKNIYDFILSRSESLRTILTGSVVKQFGFILYFWVNGFICNLERVNFLN